MADSKERGPTFVAIRHLDRFAVQFPTSKIGCQFSICFLCQLCVAVFLFNPSRFKAGYVPFSSTGAQCRREASTGPSNWILHGNKLGVTFSGSFGGILTESIVGADVEFGRSFEEDALVGAKRVKGPTFLPIEARSSHGGAVKRPLLPNLRLKSDLSILNYENDL
jgi:hypothetical protein